MMESQAARGSLPQSRRRLERPGHLRLAHWLTIGLSIVLTLAAWQWAVQTAAERARERFARAAGDVVTLFETEMQSYTKALRAGVGFVNGSGELSPEGWRRFGDALDLMRSFPGMSAIGLVYRVAESQTEQFVARERRKHPDFDLPEASGERLPLTYVYPPRLDELVTRIDLSLEPRRKEVVLRAAREGTVQITAPLDLARSKESGFLMALAFYDREVAAPVYGPREEAFAGAVIAPVIPEMLKLSRLERVRRDASVRINDEDETVYDEFDPADDAFDPDPLFREIRTLELYGRSWQFEIVSNLTLRETSNEFQPWLVLLAGVTLDALLIVVLCGLSRVSRSALEYAQDMEKDARDTSEELKRSNQSLEASVESLSSFAHIVSHDLKAPLHNIRNLTDFIEEDLRDELADSTRSGGELSVVATIDQLRRQVDRAQHLVTDILAYSRTTRMQDPVARVESASIVQEIGETLQIDDGRLSVNGSLPTIDTCRTRLYQVLANLIGNALNHHYNPQEATIAVSAEDRSEFWRFFVLDDGPGIDPRHHASIFEEFQTQQSRSPGHSTGLGLAIVRKTVEQAGGEVGVDSTLGAGAMFWFDWPKTIKVGAT